MSFPHENRPPESDQGKPSERQQADPKEPSGRVPGQNPLQQTLKDSPKGPRWPLLLVLLLLPMALLLFFSPEQPSQALPYSEFFQAVQDGRVEQVTIEGNEIRGTFREGETKLSKQEDADGKQFTTTRPDDDEALIPLLRENGVTIDVKSEQRGALTGLLYAVLPWVLIIGIWVYLARRARQAMGQGGPLSQLGQFTKKGKKFNADTAPDVGFDDVAGLRAAKQDLREVVDFMRAPQRFYKMGGKVPRGILLVGPPGTGKTLLARAVAGEAGVTFYSVSAAEFIEMFVGVGASRVREIFEEAKKNAPAIIFIDELDAIGRARGAGLGGGHDEREQTLNQLLAEMDGFVRGDLTVVLAATNRPDVLDPALLRPGRFDRRVMVDRPERDARLAILKIHTRDKPLSEDVDLDAWARRTPGFSGADLENLSNEAAINAIRRSAEIITSDDMSAAYDKVVLGNPRDSRLEPEEKRRVSVHEGGHALVAHHTDRARPLERVSIIPRGMALGATQQAPGEDRHMQTQPELEARLQVMMGGYAAERVVLGEVSTGAENDLKQATELASRMVAHWGMSEKFGVAYYDHQSEHPFLGQRIATESGTSDDTIHTIELEARRFLRQALEGATSVLNQHREELDVLIDRLVEEETLDKAQLIEILGRPSSPSQNAAASNGGWQHPPPAEHPLSFGSK